MSFRFTFNREQRYGVLGLIVLIIILLGLTYRMRNQFSKLKPKHKTSRAEKRVQKIIDSLKEAKNTRRTRQKIFPFNPNFITDYKGYTLGMSPEEIDRLQGYRAKGKWINTVTDFQQVTEVSDSLLMEIAPFFKFPDWVTQKQKKKRQITKKQGEKRLDQEKYSLNTVTAQELQQVKGVGEVLSNRIIRYRSQLHGFLGNIQLKDVYGLGYKVRKRILRKYTVKEAPKQIDVNTASTAALTEVYYFDYELARKIVDYRITHEGITSFEELSKIEDFPIGYMEQIKLYVKVDSLQNLRK